MTIESTAQEVLGSAAQWLDDGYKVELVTVARTWGSSPKPPGSIAAVRQDGVIVGSVSGGCVEKQLSESFQGQDKPRNHTHLIDDDQAKRYGLACGGQLELVFESLTDATSLRQILESLDRRERVKRCVSLGNNSAEITMATRTDQFRWNGEQLLQVFGPSWRVLIVGAGQLGRYAAEFAKALDFEVIVVDPRPAFRQAWRSPSASLLSDSPDDAVISHANDPMSAVLALSHDPNLDDLALLEALPGKAFYVGALGSIRNYQKRCDRLSGLDLSADAVARLKGPIGLPIGSRTSAEIAISIMAELIQVRNSIL